jgi:integrase
MSVKRCPCRINVTRSPATARKALGVLRQILDLAVDDRQLALSPAPSIRPPKLIHAEQQFLAPAELEALASAMTKERDRVLTLVLGWVGLRFGKAAGLNRSDVDTLRQRLRIERSVTEVRGRIEVGTTKTYARREVAVPLPGGRTHRVYGHLADDADGTTLPGCCRRSSSRLELEGSALRPRG